MKQKEIASELRTIFDLIVKMSNLSEDFYKIAITEYEARVEFKKRNAALLETENETEIQDYEIAEKKRYYSEVRPKIKYTKNQTDLLKDSFKVRHHFVLI
jgi:hypothetical protein